MVSCQKLFSLFWFALILELPRSMCPQIGVLSTYASLCVHYTIDYTLVLQSKNVSPISSLTVQVLLCTALKTIEVNSDSLCTIDAVSPKPWWPVAVDLHLQQHLAPARNHVLSVVLMNITPYVSQLWAFWRQGKKQGKLNTGEKNTLNEYSDCPHYEAGRCTCKEYSTPSLLIMIFLLVN